jgi:hypothetical protein
MIERRPSPVEIARELTKVGKDIGAEMMDFVEACRICVANAEISPEYRAYVAAKTERMSEMKVVSKDD